MNIPIAYLYRKLTIVLDCQLDSEFTGSVKQADASLKKSKTGWPVIVLEVGVSEATKKLHEYARRWLEGSCGQTKLVMLVDIQEQGRRNTSNDKWELSETDFCNYSTLYTRILQWYRSREFRLVGSFRLSVHFWYSDGDRQCVLNQAEFSPNSLIDPTTIQDVPLRLDYLIPDGSDLDTGEPLLFPLQHLVRTLQNGFEDIEIDRAQLLAREEMKKYRSL